MVYYRWRYYAHMKTYDTRSLETIAFTDDQRTVLCMILNADSKGGPYADTHNLPYFTRHAVTHAVKTQRAKLNEAGQAVLDSALAVIEAAN
jgi:hypothetical protein